MKKIKKNRDILIEYFWEHVQFGWSSQQYMVNRGMGFRGYRDLVSKMTRKSIGMMANLLERSRVQALLEEKYGADLIPSEKDLGFPTNPGVDDATSWQPAFDRLKTLYGKETGESRRMGKDLRKYKENERFLLQDLNFSIHDACRFLCRERPELIIRFQEFPREHLYRVESGDTTILEFDDWPVAWLREWESGRLV